MPVNDPLTTDPGAVDRQAPPTMVELAISSDGSAMNGLCYLAVGPGPHPTAILLHGYPGHERNLDLAQALRRAGQNVLFFHYRGSWGSEGIYSPDNAVADVKAVVAFLRRPENRSRLRVDGERLALIGHSMGGHLAFRAAADLPEIRSLAFIAGLNLGVWARLAREDPAFNEWLVDFFSGTRAVRVGNARVLVNGLVRQPDRYDLRQDAAALIGRSILMIGGAHDVVTPPAEHHEPLARAVEAQGVDLKEVVLDADHVFSGQRLALTRALLEWLGT